MSREEEEGRADPARSAHLSLGREKRKTLRGRKSKSLKVGRGRGREEEEKRKRERERRSNKELRHFWSHDTLVVDADEMPLGKSFALFKDSTSACTTGVWCLRSHDTHVVDADEMPLGESFALFRDLASACTTGVWCLLIRLIQIV